VVIHPSAVGDLLDRADAARTAGRAEVAARLYNEAATRCRSDGDLDGWTRAALGAASVYVFGSAPGKLPAELHDVLVRTTDDATRARLAAALARCWAYAGQPARGARFADEAVDRAQRVGSPQLLADCLDAALATHWGPDELNLRRSLATRLDEVTAHVLDPDARLQAHLWGLQVGCEALDVQAIHRQMRALELLGEESPRALFFGASRRLMLDLLRGRTDTAAELIGVAARAAERAGLADAWMVLTAMRAYSAAFAGDSVACAGEVVEFEKFALAEGATVVCAEAAFLWTCAGQVEHARALVYTFHPPTLEDLPRDVNWLLTLQCVLEAALAVADDDVVREAARLLAPYEGRAVFNAGAVMFHGVTDDTLARAADLLGDPVAAERLRTRALATYERLGAQWWRRRLMIWAPQAAGSGASGAPGVPRRVRLHPAPGGLWLAGPAEAAVPLRALRGFGYLNQLLRRPHQPVAALDLVGAGTGVAVQAGLGGLIDKQALTAYRRRLRDLEHEISEAEDWADLGRIDAIRAERDALLDEVARATGLGGRVRTTGSGQERARIATRKAISAAIERITAVDQALGKHLHATIRTGLSCSYEPDPDDAIMWILDERATGHASRAEPTAIADRGEPGAPRPDRSGSA
jgi:hypothetical protein